MSAPVLDARAEPQAKKKPRSDRIRVLVNLPHLEKYGHEPTVELVYGCQFEVSIGDAVKCPPTPLYGKWSTGIVIALDGKGYRGPVKQVKRA